MASPQPQQNDDFVSDGFVKMQDDNYELSEEEALELEARGRRLRRAALATGILMSVSILCMIYNQIAIHWVIIDWSEPELTSYTIIDNMGAFKMGILCDTLIVILQTMVRSISVYWHRYDKVGMFSMIVFLHLWYPLLL